MENIDKKIYKNRWLILFNVVLVTFMSCLDGSIVNVALPIMSKRLNVSMQAIEWVVTSYLIVISATILIYGRLGDIKGKVNVFKFGILLFTLGSFMGGMAGSLKFLVAARIAQAIGAGATMATSQGIITHVFPANERGRALGISGSFVALGNMAGPPLGGFIVSALNWNYIFLINVPIGIIAFILGLKTFPKEVDKLDETLDLKGAVLFAVAVVLVFGCLVQGQDVGYTNPLILLGFAIAAVSFAAFIYVEKKNELPLLQLEIFNNKLFSISIICAFISFVAMGANSIIQPFYLQDAVKLSPAATGLFMMVFPIVLCVVAPFSGYLSDKIGSEFLTFLGLTFYSIGLLLLSTLNQNSNLGLMTIFIAITSVGNGLFQSPNTSLIMSTVPKNKLGIAGSVNALVRNLGIVFGVSMSTTLLYNRMSHKIGRKVISYVVGRDDVFIYGMKWVYISASVVCAAGAVITALRLYRSKRKIAA